MKSLFFKIIRVVAGRLILVIDFLTRPRKMVRDRKSQVVVEQQAQNLQLYQFKACPFCVKTRRTIHKLNIPVATRDAKNDAFYRQELLEQGGKLKVPCLRIEEDNQIKWMYESKNIISYLNSRFQTEKVA